MLGSTANTSSMDTGSGGGACRDDMAQDHIETLRKLLAEKRGVLLPGAAKYRLHKWSQLAD
jgi:hypothetical protein